MIEMDETLLILKESFKAKPIMIWKEKEFWANEDSLFIINRGSGQLLKMYPQDILTDNMIEFELN